MVLSETAVSRLYEAAYSPDRIGRARERELARAAVRAAAEELGLDPEAPALPRFGKGEDPLGAAVRVLGLDKVAKQVEQYHRQRAALEKVQRHFALLERRRGELRVLELDRLRESVIAGRAPEPAPEKLREELDAIRRELETIGNTEHLEQLLPFRSDLGIIQDALSEEEWLAVSFYLHLIAERLRALTADEPRNSRAHMAARTVDSQARGYARRLNNRPARMIDGEPTDREHESRLRGIAAAIELADLYSLPERRERTIEELAAVPMDAA